MQSRKLLKLSLLLALSAILSSLTVVFGAAPMRVARRSFGRLAYWAGHLAVAAAMLAIGLGSHAVAFFALIVLVGVYSEVEEHRASLFTSGATAIVATAGVVALTVGTWLHLTKTNLLQTVKNQLAPLAERLNGLNPQAGLDLDVVMQQLPSGLVIVLMAALVIALVWERRFYGWLRLERPATTLDLRSFRLPDITVWIVMLVVLGAFLKHGQEDLQIASVNGLNVLVVLYFFQGLAVVAHAFRIFRLSPFWQGFWYLMIVLQLFLLVSLVGFVDYWMDFRDRMTRKPAENQKGF